jgi:hypothetical protein
MVAPELRLTNKWSTIMKKFISLSVLALTVAGGAAFAQTTAPAPAVKAPTATTAPAVTVDPATEAKFKAADKSGKGFIEGADLTPYKEMLTKVDTDKDGKISKVEFAAAVKAGVIK